MTTPAPAPAPTPPPAPESVPAPPQPQPAAPPAGPQPTTPPAGPDSVARLEAVLAEERRARKDAEAALAAAQAASMTEAEKAIAAARAEGKAEGERTAAVALVAAEFRVAAAGRLANPEAAIAALDLTKLLNRSGNPDRAAIAALVEQLAAVPAQQGNGHHVIPAGPRAPVPGGAGDSDWIRAIQRPGRRR